jgi:SAM-dependent methyltransferase
MDIGDYARHARIWDWGGFDDTAEYEYWRACAAAYGTNVLIPMCALGQTGAYLAERGFQVTAFDITPEMIEEGRKRFGHIRQLRLLQGDIRSFRLDPPPFDLSFVKDLGHLHTIEDVQAALTSLHRHLRPGGGLAIEAGLPAERTSYAPPETFRPEAETGRTYISQTVHLEYEDGAVETFEHSFYLQSYTRDVWLDVLQRCGYEIQGEYRDREKAPWRPGDGFLAIEAVKPATLES